VCSSLFYLSRTPEISLRLEKEGKCFTRGQAFLNENSLLHTLMRSSTQIGTIVFTANQFAHLPSLSCLLGARSNSKFVLECMVACSTHSESGLQCFFSNQTQHIVSLLQPGDLLFLQPKKLFINFHVKGTALKRRMFSIARPLSATEIPETG